MEAQEHPAGFGADQPRLQGHDVVDEQGEKIGAVSDVVFDSATGDAAWVVVNTGVLRAAHFVPLQNAYVSAEGRLVVPFDKRTVKGSPRAGRDHIMTSELQHSLVEHYSLAV
ncbi:MAG: PRC-barrel domain-containing protein [Actinomycetota bacterium]|nr:PRC-barrel domain-containing protein [Actinomycetota bacterium]